MRRFTICLALGLLALAGFMAGLAVVNAALPHTTPGAATAMIEPSSEAAPVNKCISIDRVLETTPQFVPRASHEVITGSAAHGYAKGLQLYFPDWPMAEVESFIIFSSPLLETVQVSGFIGTCLVLPLGLSRSDHEALMAHALPDI